MEAKLREANVKISKLETEKKDLKQKADEQVETLTTQLNNLKSELKKTSLEKDNLAKKVDRIAGEKNSALESEIEEREKTISEKESEISDLKQLSDIKERQLKFYPVRFFSIIKFWLRCLYYSRIIRNINAIKSA